MTTDQGGQPAFIPCRVNIERLPNQTHYKVSPGTIRYQSERDLKDCCVLVCLWYLVAPASSPSAKEVASRPKSPALQGKWQQEPRSVLFKAGGRRTDTNQQKNEHATTLMCLIHHF